MPHLSVRGNLLYGARRAPPGPVNFDDVVGILGLSALLGRAPHTLAGGERQRVAVGRALLAQPRVLLMDEPLASLNPARRDAIMPFLATVRRSLATPIVYVTHQVEALATLADTVVLLEAGRVVAAGDVANLSTFGDVGIGLPAQAGAVLDAEVPSHDPARRLSNSASARARG